MLSHKIGATKILGACSGLQSDGVRRRACARRMDCDALERRVLLAAVPWPRVADAQDLIAVADFNGDGRADVISLQGFSAHSGGSNLESTAVLLRAGNGDGSFGQATLQAVLDGAPEYVSAGDVNGDGRADVVAIASGGIPGGGCIDTLLGSANGLSTQAIDTPLSDLTFAGGFQIADVNDDGNGDLIGIYPNIVQVALANPQNAGTFAAPTSSPLQIPAGVNLPSYPGSAVAADVNGDGYADVVIYGSGTPGGGDEDVLLVYLNHQGGFDFSSSALLPAVRPPQLAVGDYNGDGLADVAVVSAAHGGTQVLTLLAQRDQQGIASGALGPPAVSFVNRAREAALHVREAALNAREAALKVREAATAPLRVFAANIGSTDPNLDLLIFSDRDGGSLRSLFGSTSGRFFGSNGQ